MKIFVIGEIHTNKKYSHTNNFGHIYNNNNNMLFRQQSIDSWWDGEYNIRNKYGKYKYGKYKKLLSTMSNIVKYCQISSLYISLLMSIVSQWMNVLVPEFKITLWTITITITYYESSFMINQSSIMIHSNIR